MTRLILIAALCLLHCSVYSNLAAANLARIPAKLSQIKEFKAAAVKTVATKLVDLKNTAVQNIKSLADDIDLSNLNQLDILQIGPLLKRKYDFLKQLYNKPATKVNVKHIYGDELSSHFNPGYHRYQSDGHYHDLPKWVLVGSHV